MIVWYLFFIFMVIGIIVMFCIEYDAVSFKCDAEYRKEKKKKKKIDIAKNYIKD